MEDLPMEEDQKVAELPTEIFEHIHSFLEGKVAAQTALFSKSLYSAWSSRPNLDLRPIPSRLCYESSQKIMQRYEDSKLKIETFTIDYKGHYHLLKELIVRALKLGAINLKIELWSLRLPVEVLGFETLETLSVTNAQIELCRTNVEVPCSMLKSLHLSGVTLIGDFYKFFILRCPLLEKLVCDARLLSFSNNPHENEFHKLVSLSLDNLRDRDALFFQQLLLRFPFLKNLAIRHIYNCGKIIRICSQSLQSISIVVYYRALTLEIDAPSIRKFHFVGSPSSCLTFEPTCSEWESDIRVICYQGTDSSLSSLRKLLQNLSQSKVSLTVCVKYPSKYVCDCSARYEPRPVVENLKFMEHAPNSGLLDGLFFACRPKLVNLPPGNNELLELLCEKLVDKTSEKNDHCIPNPSVKGLEEVNVEVFEESVGKWMPLPWKTLLDALVDHQNTQKFRFQLRWRPESCAP